MTRTVDKLPAYLKRHCSEQDYSRYTPINQASWRYIMRRALPFFRKNAVQGYEEGLVKTGLRVDRIPRIEEMDEALQRFGWGAVPVCGFIPPWAFLEFQARKILPIATDMRTAEHIGYTPAPDIVHEAAGHAPILPDLDYSNYLSHYARLCTRAIYSGQDLRYFEAVRVLSDIKENPDSTPEDIAQAELNLEKAGKSITYVSESSKVARMSWWTAEYGLAGSLAEPKIYGAGLLSSVAEAKNCLTPAVKKIPFSIDCIKYTYNITKPQPQLFVCETMQDLLDVLGELDGMLAYRKGELASLKLAHEADAVSTVVLDSGIAISGKIAAYEARGEVVDFIKWSGPVQLSSDDVQLEGQGPEYHEQGFSTPIGRWRGVDKNPALLSDGELADLGLGVGKRAKLAFESGFEVEGNVTRIFRKHGKILYIAWHDCTVKKGSTTYFQPSWGTFDMAVGVSLPSVYGGPADRSGYGASEETETISTAPGRKNPFSERELSLFKQYTRLRELRESPSSALTGQLETLSGELLKDFSDEWLLLLESYEMARERLKLNDKTPWVGRLKATLTDSSGSFNADQRELIDRGMDVIAANAH